MPITIWIMYRFKVDFKLQCWMNTYAYLELLTLCLIHFKLSSKTKNQFQGIFDFLPIQELLCGKHLSSSDFQQMALQWLEDHSHLTRVNFSQPGLLCAVKGTQICCFYLLIQNEHFKHGTYISREFKTNFLLVTNIQAAPCPFLTQLEENFLLFHPFSQALPGEITNKFKRRII